VVDLPKKFLNTSVYDESKKRIKYIFDNFDNIYLSFSGGKDSTVMFHLVMEEAIARNKKIGVLFVDWECQLTSTINHIKEMITLYKDNIDLYWVQLPITTTNGCSQIEPEWTAWDDKKQSLWVRQPETDAITDKKFFPFYTNNMTFEEFMHEFGLWYANNKKTAAFVGMRATESFKRLQMITNRKIKDNKKIWLTKSVGPVQFVYPIYDWTVEDIWTYYGKYKKLYNPLYDNMYKAGLKLSQMRVDEPFGDNQRIGLWLYQIIEPSLWAKVVQRVSGANMGALYSKESGKILGNKKITLPPKHTWKSYVMFLLDTMPPASSNHYKNKISVYLKFYSKKGYTTGIPDAGDIKNESAGTPPSWQRICKCILRNDYWCSSLGFSPTKITAYNKYVAMMKNRRNRWNIFPTEESK
jgi:predicted phosphoadenosine phosphosulfate sulfurtransferase